jgi:hypothetical protein
VFGTARLVEAAGIGVAAVAPTVAVAAAAFIGGGIGGGAGSVADALLVQSRVPDAARGRVRAVNDAVIAAAYSASLGLGGFIVAALGARGTYGLAAAGCAVAGIAAVVALSRPQVAVAGCGDAAG